MPRKWICEDDAETMFCPFRAKKARRGCTGIEIVSETCETSDCMSWCENPQDPNTGTCLLIPPMED